MQKTLDTAFIHYVLQGDLLTGTYKKTHKITLEMAKDIVKQRLDFTGHQPVRGLIFNEGVRSVEKKARDYFASEGSEGLLAVAYVVENKFNSFIINFFLAATKSRFPVRIFSKKESAIKWLEQFRK